MISLGNDNVVAQWNAEQLPGCRKLLRECAVLLAGASFAGWVIMGYNDVCRAVDNCIGKNFSRMRQDGIERPNGDGPLCNKPLATIERQAHKMLLLPGTNVD